MRCGYGTSRRHLSERDVELLRQRVKDDGQG